MQRLSLCAAFVLSVILIPITACGQVNGVGQHPALGWGSWTQQLLNGGASWANEAHIKSQSDALKATGLQQHGYVFINIDSGWQSGFDGNGRPMVNMSLYPNGLAAVADYIHKNGQKAGIYWIPGLQYPAYSSGGTIYGTTYPLASIVNTTLPGNAFSISQPCCNYWHMKIDFTRPGTQEYVDSVVNLFASWGFDAIKLDGVTPGSGDNDLSIDNRAEVQAWSKAIAQSGRPMELTISWNLDHNYVSTWQAWANARRIEDDVNCGCSTATQWKDITRLFPDLEVWQKDAGPTLGWNDLDSLEVGSAAQDGLTNDERQSTMTLWAIANSPMIIGDDLNRLDAFGLQLLTNDNVIAVDQSGTPGLEITGGNNPVWASPVLANGSYNVALFNLNNSSSTTAISFSSLGFTGAAVVYDLWAGRDLGSFTDSYSAALNAHASALVRITPSAPQQIPQPPTSLRADANNGQINLSWSASSGATSYNVYRGTSSGTETRVANGITVTTYADTSVANATTYYYKVSAVNSSGESAQSTEVSATPTAVFSVSTSNTSLSLSANTSTITITPNGDTRTLTFNCTNLPAGYGCTFTPSSLALSGLSTSQNVTLKVSSQAASLKFGGRRPAFWNSIVIAALLPSCLFVSIFVPGEMRRRRNPLIARMMLTALVVTGISLTSCGGGSSASPATPPSSSKTYSFQVNLQAGGSTAQSLNYALTVQ